MTNWGLSYTLRSVYVPPRRAFAAPRQEDAAYVVFPERSETFESPAWLTLARARERVRLL